MEATQLLTDGYFIGACYHTSTGEYCAGKDDASIRRYTKALKADGAIVTLNNEHATVRFWRKHPPMLGEGI